MFDVQISVADEAAQERLEAAINAAIKPIEGVTETTCVDSDDVENDKEED